MLMFQGGYIDADMYAGEPFIATPDGYVMAMDPSQVYPYQTAGGQIPYVYAQQYPYQMANPQIYNVNPDEGFVSVEHTPYLPDDMPDPSCSSKHRGEDGNKFADLHDTERQEIHEVLEKSKSSETLKEDGIGAEMSDSGVSEIEEHALVATNSKTEQQPAELDEIATKSPPNEDCSRDVPSCTKDSSPSCAKDSSPSCTRDSSPLSAKDSSPSSAKDSSPSFAKDSSPSFAKDSSPSFAKDSSPSSAKDSSAKHSSPSSATDSSPSSATDSSPSSAKDSSPSSAIDSSPSSAIDSSPSSATDSSPSSATDFSPSSATDFSPSCARDSSPSCARDSSPSCARDSSPSCARDSSPSFTRDSSPSCTRDSSQSCVKDSPSISESEECVRRLQYEEAFVSICNKTSTEATVDIPVIEEDVSTNDLLIDLKSDESENVCENIEPISLSEDTVPMFSTEIEDSNENEDWGSLEVEEDNSSEQVSFQENSCKTVSSNEAVQSISTSEVLSVSSDNEVRVLKQTTVSHQLSPIIEETATSTISLRSSESCSTLNSPTPNDAVVTPTDVESEGSRSSSCSYDMDEDMLAELREERELARKLLESRLANMSMTAPNAQGVEEPLQLKDLGVTAAVRQWVREVTPDKAFSRSDETFLCNQNFGWTFGEEEEEDEYYEDDPGGEGEGSKLSLKSTISREEPPKNVQGNPFGATCSDSDHTVNATKRVASSPDYDSHSPSTHRKSYSYTKISSPLKDSGDHTNNLNSSSETFEPSSCQKYFKISADNSGTEKSTSQAFSSSLELPKDIGDCKSDSYARNPNSIVPSSPKTFSGGSQVAAEGITSPYSSGIGSSLATTPANSPMHAPPHHHPSSSARLPFLFLPPNIGAENSSAAASLNAVHCCTLM